MADKEIIMVLKVDLECERCNKKIRRVLLKIKDKMSINTISFDEKPSSPWLTCRRSLAVRLKRLRRPEEVERVHLGLAHVGGSGRGGGEVDGGGQGRGTGKGEDGNEEEKREGDGRAQVAARPGDVTTEEGSAGRNERMGASLLG